MRANFKILGFMFKEWQLKRRTLVWGPGTFKESQRGKNVKWQVFCVGAKQGNYFCNSDSVFRCWEGTLLYCQVDNK